MGNFEFSTSFNADVNPIPDVVNEDDTDVEEREDVCRCYDVPGRE